MRIILNIVGVVLVFFGGVWFLQGINVLPGSFMTGQIKWAICGGIAFVAGVVVLVLANRKRQSVTPPA
jgi:type IV secretory pathway VirB6-like protein